MLQTLAMEEFHQYSPLGLALLCFLSASLAMFPTNITTDQSSLLALRAHISVDPLQILAKNWSVGSSVCDWIGVSCGSRHRRVTGLDISNMNLSGTLPPQLGNLSFLVSLDVSANNFHGELPHEFLPHWIGSFPQLRLLNLRNNSFTGIIPSSISNMSNLQYIRLSFNHLLGDIPRGIFNISSLQGIGLANNGLSGVLPSDVCYHLPGLSILNLSFNKLNGQLPSKIGNWYFLQQLDMESNSLTGSIPIEIFNLSKLSVMSVAQNQLSGNLPSTFGYRLPNLEYLYLDINYFSGALPSSISNSSNLRLIEFGDNKFTGPIPASLGDLRFLEHLKLGNNLLIKGSIPDGIGNFSSLIELDLSNNELSGSLPATIKDLQKLQYMDLSMNKLISRVPLHSLCALHNLDTMNLGQNQFMASIPKCFGNLTSLRHLNLSHNRLCSAPPEEIWNLKDLLELDLSSNLLSGSLPYAITNMKMANWVDLSTNQFSGSIPESIGKMLSLESLDISHNFLSGSIPMSMENLRYLKYINLSFNNLSGEIPSKGPFTNCTAESFTSNQALCGARRFHVPPCPTISAHRSRTKRVRRMIYILLGVIIAVGALSFGFVYLRYRKKDEFSSGVDISLVAMPERISYFELLQATNGYNESNLLGAGSFGYVYRGTLDDGRAVAVKVFNLQVDGAFKSFDVECEVLRNLRHRNLTRVISSCSTPEFKALVLEFMPNGSLEKWLYSHNYFPDLMQRLDILSDVACALQYLHCEYSTPVIHCDLKPSNVLLDQDMVAHLSDFGLTKLLDEENSITYTETLATLGYLAPGEEFSPNVIDANLLKESDECIGEKLSCIASIMKVALGCTMESPRERSSIQNVLVALQKIKLQYMSPPSSGTS
ncbi:unnamed protein product [Coffea canephora]|uniref:Protein kinase domain-containing protein n=1 Tax=Coffea canephora TaxID=49390 RepID=A0A068URY3_COFCA|nr:unnamed protein product [Coffea canephora]